jgi:hypothetical protein
VKMRSAIWKLSSLGSMRICSIGLDSLCATKLLT